MDDVAKFAVGDRVRFSAKAIATRNWQGNIRADKKVHVVTRLLPFGDVVLENGDGWSRYWLEDD